MAGSIRLVIAVGWSQIPTRRIIEFLLALSPWALSLYAHYWLQQGELWNVESPYRALISVVLIGLGMLYSFLLYMRLTRNRAKP